MHRYPAPVAYTFQGQPKEHTRCETPCPEWTDHDDLNDEEKGKDAKVDLVGNEIWDIMHRSIFHIT